MSKMYFYADAESVEVLRSGRAKALMVGGDFGYGNFGDVLQHLGAATRLRDRSSLDLVSIFALEAISRFVEPKALRLAYGLDALMFLSFESLRTEDAQRLGLQQILVINNVSIVYLYGGGYLNELWGDFSLGIVEFLLERLPSALYVMSGQQVSPAYAARVAQHVNRFKPLLVGVRDRDSLRDTLKQGVLAEFSFDDAVEQLLALSSRFQLRQGSGAFIHLNSSGYTGNDLALSEMARHLGLVAERVGANDLPVLLQAFQDGREEVVDSIETVKRLELAFPFSGAETALLVEAVMAPKMERIPHVLQGEFGYSCSYHVTMWLQLNGIPCWLRGSNGYYDQKRRSLGVEGDFENFLEKLPRVDHGRNLAGREEWLQKLDTIIGAAKPINNAIELEATAGGDAEFHYKGEPRLEVRLDRSWREVCELRDAKERLLGDLERCKDEVSAEGARRESYEDELRRANEQLEAARTEREALIVEAEAGLVQRGAIERELEAAKAAQVESVAALARFFDESQPVLARIASVQFVHEYVRDQQAILESRLLACSEQLTAVGHDARRYRQEAEAEHDARITLSIREHEANNRLGNVLASRSWRWTRPLRAFNRFLATRRFDAKGDVGLFEVVRLVGSRVPIPRSWKSQLGNWLRRMRRR